ncbi:Ankyrin repeat and SAM domain-containing protein 1A, partial [Durusdinium trenchii]
DSPRTARLGSAAPPWVMQGRLFLLVGTPWSVPRAAEEVPPEASVRRELAKLLHQHFVMPTPTSTVGEMKDMFATMRFIATLRCGESTWCAKAAPLKSLRMVSSEDIWRQLHASQNPERCEDARYLIYHDDRSTSGFGWNAFLLFSAFLQALGLRRSAS